MFKTIIGFLTGGSSSKIYLIVFAVIGGIMLSMAGVIYYLNYKVDDLKDDLVSYEIALDASVKISNENETQFQQYKTENKQILEDLNIAYQKDLKKVKEFTQKKEEIKNVKKSDDAINAAIINSTLIWLRNKTISANTSKEDSNNSTKQVFGR